jgi:hypothetical protein
MPTLDLMGKAHRMLGGKQMLGKYAERWRGKHIVSNSVDTRVVFDFGRRCRRALTVLSWFSVKWSFRFLALAG